jgi:hypothetical protein
MPAQRCYQKWNRKPYLVQCVVIEQAVDVFYVVFDRNRSVPSTHYIAQCQPASQYNGLNSSK